MWPPNASNKWRIIMMTVEKAWPLLDPDDPGAYSAWTLRSWTCLADKCVYYQTERCIAVSPMSIEVIVVVVVAVVDRDALFFMAKLHRRAHIYVSLVTMLVC